MELRPYQTEAIDLLRQSLGQGSRRPVLQLPTGAGKCLGPEVDVMMYDGTRRQVKDVHVGDKLLGDDNTPRTVTARQDGISKMYKIIPVKGEVWRCNENHILSLVCTADNPFGHKGENVDISVQQYLASSKTTKHVLKQYTTEYNEWGNTALYKFDPYLIGLWLGDGTSACSMITNSDIEIQDYLHSAATACGLVCREGRYPGKAPQFSLVTPRGKKNPLWSFLKENFTLHGKKILPEKYITTSRTQRLALLAGLLDTDGYYNKGSFDIAQKQENVADGISTLCRSLGYRVVRSKKIVNGAVYYRMSITGDFKGLPMRVERKKPLLRNANRDHRRTGFVVEDDGAGQYVGIMVDGNGRFLLGDFTVCHNTAIAVEIIRRMVARAKRVLFLAPRRELIYQASERLHEAGIYNTLIMAGETYQPSDVMVASFDTLHSRAIRNDWIDLPPADVVFCDEAHLSIAQTRQDILGEYSVNGAYIIGLTATPARGDGRGLGEVYDDLIESWPVARLIDEGYLAPVRYFAPAKLDLSEVRTKGKGDYVEKDLGEFMDKPKLIGDILDNWLRLAHDKKTVVFCTTKAHSRHVCEEFVRRGIKAEHLDSDTPQDERAQILDRVDSGETQVLCNVYIASYGLDIPSLECAVIARPTRNITLYLQTAGRVLRTSPGKDHAILIDHAGVIAEHGLVEDPQPWTLDSSVDIRDLKKEQREEDREPKEITCGDCGTIFKNSRICPFCGHQEIPEGKPIPTYEADLVEVKAKDTSAAAKRNRTTDWDRKAEIMGMFKHYAKDRGYSPGWAAHKYRAMMGVWPNDPRVNSAALVKPDQEVANYIRHELIKHAKRKAA